MVLKFQDFFYKKIIFFLTSVFFMSIYCFIDISYFLGIVLSEQVSPVMN